jgi:thiamine pyrophosphokinase
MSDHKVESFRGKAQQTGKILLVGPLAATVPWERFPAAHWARLGVDGGAALAAPGQFDLTVGDGDSGAVPLDVRWPIHKDATDLELALELLPARLPVTLWGFTGGRPDHQMVVWGALHAHCVRHGTHFDVLNELSSIAVRPAGEFTFQEAGLFSLWSLLPATFGLRGACRYPLERPTPCPPLSGHTLSNYASGPFTVTCDAPFFLYSEKAL